MAGMAIGKSTVVSYLAEEGHDQYQLIVRLAEWARYSAEMIRAEGGGGRRDLICA